MAITNQERVGKAMDLLRQGLAAYAEREFKALHKAQAGAQALGYVGDDRALAKKALAGEDVEHVGACRCDRGQVGGIRQPFARFVISLTSGRYAAALSECLLAQAKRLTRFT